MERSKLGLGIDALRQIARALTSRETAAWLPAYVLEMIFPETKITKLLLV